MKNHPLRVLVVDDSAYMRKVISEMVRRSPHIEVVGTARNGRDALQQVAALRPDVVTLDLFMDELDGVGFLKAQMDRQPIPVVVCSSAGRGGETVVAAMEAGAVEFVQKPTALALESVYEIANQLVEKILIAASIAPEKLPIPSPVSAPPAFRLPARPNDHFDAVVIGISTGGPTALRTLLPRFPVDLPVPIAIVLHMPVGYTGPLAQKLDEISALEIREASEGLEMRPGRVILAQSGCHLVLQRRDGAVVSTLPLSPADLFHRPAADVLFRSAAEVYAGRTLGLVMTGMGNDGLQGAAWIKAQGGTVWTEAEESCVIYGMPRSVVEAGLSDRSVHLDMIVEAILESL
jgi:two-component system chemotaxis response regulator CheB